MLYIANITIMVQFISPTLYFLPTIVFPCFNLFQKQKIRNNTVETTFSVPGASTEWQKMFRVNPIIENDIGFLLEFNQYSGY